MILVCQRSAKQPGRPTPVHFYRLIYVIQHNTVMTRAGVLIRPMLCSSLGQEIHCEKIQITTTTSRK
jgi:hypothetical protein